MSSSPELQVAAPYDADSMPYNPYLGYGLETAQAMRTASHLFVSAAMAPARMALAANELSLFPMPIPAELGRFPGALVDLSEHLTRKYPAPAFGIESTAIAGEAVAVSQESVSETPFSSLIRFNRDFAPGQERHDPKVLIVSALSGHHATLHRPTIEELLPNADVHLLAWKDARYIPTSDGRFGMDEYIDQVAAAIKTMGVEDTHVVAICQPTVPVSAALARLAEDAPLEQPLSLTLISGPVDTRVNAEMSGINDFAKNDIDDLCRKLIGKVPNNYPGAGRLAYFGEVQQMAFYAMDPMRHIKSYGKMFLAQVMGNADKAAKISDFYEEYNAMLSMAAEYWRETVTVVFQEQQLAQGTMLHHGRPLRMDAINTHLLTVEGGKDEFCPPGQTRAAHDIFSGLTAAQRAELLVEDAGHYGTWAGSSFRNEVAPRMRKFFELAGASRGIAYDTPTLPTITP